MRLILIALGLLFIVGLFFYTRRQQSERRRRGTESEPTLREPVIRIEPNWSRRPDSAGTPTIIPAEVPPLPDFAPVEKVAGQDTGAREDKIFTLTVQLPDDGVAAEAVTRTLKHLGCKPGVGHIYHSPDAEGQALYSVANLFEPGVLDPIAPEVPLRGLVFFFTARPGTNATLPFGRMLGAARETAERLGGRVQDDGHRPLTAARELELKMAAERNA
ncbi:MAG: cell division protein ZipA C-terminal FtsZ-binding domain-containing protein [Gammaproteobacteria bacterium]